MTSCEAERSDIKEEVQWVTMISCDDGSTVLLQPACFYYLSVSVSGISYSIWGRVHVLQATAYAKEPESSASLNFLVNYFFCLR